MNHFHLLSAIWKYVVEIASLLILIVIAAFASEMGRNFYKSIHNYKIKYNANRQKKQANQREKRA